MSRDSPVATTKGCTCHTHPLTGSPSTRERRESCPVHSTSSESTRTPDWPEGIEEDQRRAGERAVAELVAASAVGVITAEPITTYEQLEGAYQQAIRGRHISEIAPVLALRNAALEAFAPSSGAGTPVAWLVTATGGNSGGGRWAHAIEADAEEDAQAWRINGATVTITPLFACSATRFAPEVMARAAEFKGRADDAGYLARAIIEASQ